MDNIREIQLKIYAMFKVFHEICVENDLRYYFLGGTMLGAVRHKGFIPWDDDIDVGMPREDYERFQKIAPKYFSENENIKILSYKTEKNYIYDFIKVADMSHLIQDEKLANMEIGIFIDVFPIDGCKSKNKKQVKINYLIYDGLRILKNSHFNNTNGKPFLKRVAIKLFSKIPLSFYHKIMYKYLKSQSFDKSRFAGNFSGHWREKEIMPKDVYGKPTLITFEGEQYYGVEKPDVYLKTLYGDYMKIPPEYERLRHF